MMNHAPPSNEAVQKYLPLMHELRIRMDLVSQACDGQLGLTAPYAHEYACLQFRRMCEIIALGCLFLHGDIPFISKNKAKKEWNAEKIMNMLHREHPYSFPQAIIRENIVGEGWKIQANSKPNALSRAEFKKLYCECGEVLHRGTIQSVESSTHFTNEHYQKVVDWQEKIVDLMNEHAITKTKEKEMYVVSLKTTSGFPESTILTQIGDGQLHAHTYKMDVSEKLRHSYISKMP